MQDREAHRKIGIRERASRDRRPVNTMKIRKIQIYKQCLHQKRRKQIDPRHQIDLAVFVPDVRIAVFLLRHII